MQCVLSSPLLSKRSVSLERSYCRSCWYASPARCLLKYPGFPGHTVDSLLQLVFIELFFVGSSWAKSTVRTYFPFLLYQRLTAHMIWSVVCLRADSATLPVSASCLTQKSLMKNQHRLFTSHTAFWSSHSMVISESLSALYWPVVNINLSCAVSSS